MWNDCWLDFMDCWSEGIAMPLGAMLMALMVGWEIKPDFILGEVHNGEHSKFFDVFYRICVTFIVPIVMAFVLAGQMIDFFKCDANAAVVELVCYIISAALLVVFWVVALVGGRKKETVQ